MHTIELDATVKLAKSKHRAGQSVEAEGLYRRVLKEDPDNAEALHFLGLALLGRGKAGEALGLVRRSVELRPDKADYHNNLSTVLGRTGKCIEALGSAARALELRPDFPEALSNQGAALEQLGRLPEAVEAYRRATELRPDYAEALGNLGNALSRMGKHEEAIEHLSRAAKLRPRSPHARKQLGNALRRAGRPSEAVVAYRLAVELNPRDADAYNNLGAALQECGKVPEAEEALRTCLSINPDHSDAHWNRGLALLSLGRWREGWIEYEWRRHLREDVGQKREFPQPAWNGSPVEGRTVLLLCEQGLGDSIQFIRYAPLLAQRGAKVIVECQAKLKPLLSTVKGVEKVIARGEPLPTFDVHARLLTLPCIFGTTPDDVPADVPYLHVDEARVQRWKRKLEETCGPASDAAPHQRRIGIVWQGNTSHKGDRWRSVPLSAFEPLAQVPGVRLISLQKGPGSEQIAQCRDRFELLEWSDPEDTTGEALLGTCFPADGMRTSRASVVEPTPNHSCANELNFCKLCDA